jgi:hypothetical protein
VEIHQLILWLGIFDVLVIFAARQPVNFFILAGIVVFLIVLVFSLINIFKAFIKRKQKAALIEEKILSDIGSKFGEVVSYEASSLSRSLCFEHHGTLFELKVIPTIDGAAKATGTENKVQFNLPNLHEKFYIRHRSFFFSKNPTDCQEVQVKMPDDFIFVSCHPQFLSDLMEKEDVRNEICKYQKTVSGKFDIAFENGLFTATWYRGLYSGDEMTWDSAWYGENAQAEGQKLQQICQTAVVFYDALSKI